MIKRFAASAMLTIGLLVGISSVSIVSAQNLDDACDINSNSTLCQETRAQGGGLGLIAVLRNIANMVSIVAGIAGVTMVMIGGFRYVRSEGDPSKLSEAQSTIVYALIGLAVAATGQILVAFVLNRL